jgi:hypothetical protein
VPRAGDVESRVREGLCRGRKDTLVAMGET